MATNQELAETLGIPLEYRAHLDPDGPPGPRLALAQGLLPVPHQHLISLLYAMMRGSDPVLKKTALKTLRRQPPKLLMGTLGASTHPKVLEFFAFATKDDELREHLSLLRPLTDQAFLKLAEVGSGRVIDIVAANQERIVALPQLYWYLKANTNSQQAVLDKVESFLRLQGIELPEQPAALKPKAPPVPPPVQAPRGAPPAPEAGSSGVQGEWGPASGGIAVAGELRALFDDLGVSLQVDWVIARSLLDGTAEGGEALARQEQIEVGDEEEEFDFTSGTGQADFDIRLLQQAEDGTQPDAEERLGIEQQIRAMGVGQKIKLAYLGNSTARKVLIRDSNKLVACAVIKSGRMNDREVVDVSGSRNVDAEVIRLISLNPEWIRNYQVKKALVNNPKCPMSISVGLVPHLHSADLAAVSRNRNVPSVVFQAANRLLKKKKG